MLSMIVILAIFSVFSTGFILGSLWTAEDHREQLLNEHSAWMETFEEGFLGLKELIEKEKK